MPRKRDEKKLSEKVLALTSALEQQSDTEVISLSDISLPVTFYIHEQTGRIELKVRSDLPIQPEKKTQLPENVRSPAKKD